MEVSINTNTQIHDVRQVDAYCSGRKDEMENIHDEKDANAHIQLHELLRYFGEIWRRTYTKYMVPVCEFRHGKPKEHA